MAVCNLFTKLNNHSGNFLLFSQYVEDITRNTSEGDNWKVVPTRFVALNIDFSKLDSVILDDIDLNSKVTNYFQNCFENACAYGRVNYNLWAEYNNMKDKTWNPNISKNLFWNSMFNSRLITTEKYNENGILYSPEIMYYGDITMHSYNEHKGMGYSEIYCYIPTNSEQMRCQIIKTNENLDRIYDSSNTNIYLEGFNDSTHLIGNYPQHYYYNKDFSMSFDDNEIANLSSVQTSKYNINTIVVLYSIFRKSNNDWETIYSNIPMGMYITGKFDNDNNLTNTITKYISTSYGTGTSYGLRICTRFSAIPNQSINIQSDLIVDDSSVSSICQLMTAMNENLSRMLDISKSSINTTQQYKDLLSIFKNNKTNVPYVKSINGVDYWFVNGKFVSSVSAEPNRCGVESDYAIAEKLGMGIKDYYEDNSYTEMPCDCTIIDNKELAEALGLEYDGDSSTCPPTNSEFEVATNEEVQNKFL